MEDFLGTLTEADLRQFHILHQESVIAVRDEWWKKYETCLYDWDLLVHLGKNARPAWTPIRLTQGYFMVVLLTDLERMTKYPSGRKKVWYANVARDIRTDEITNVYGARRGKDGESRTVYAHREVMRVHTHGQGEADHVNGDGLDNRGKKRSKRTNLIFCMNESQNHHNSRRRRKINNTDLLPGVERRGNCFGGIRCERIKKRGKGSVRVIRSDRNWPTQAKAHEWYLNELKKLNARRTAWAHRPMSVSKIDFSPALKENLKAPF